MAMPGAEPRRQRIDVGCQRIKPGRPTLVGRLVGAVGRRQGAMHWAVDQPGPEVLLPNGKLAIGGFTNRETYLLSSSKVL